MPGPYALVGRGLQSLGAPGALRIDVTARPTTVSVGTANPANLFHAGMLRLGTADGFLPAVPLDADQQLLPCPRACTQLGYSLATGVHVTVTEIASGAALMPWDRNPASVGAAWATYLTGPSGTTILGSYTVPNGRKLWISTLNVQTALSILPSGIGGRFLWAERNQVIAASVFTWERTVGTRNESTALGAPLILLPGDLLRGVASSSDSGGQCYCQVEWSGTLFDA